MRIYHFINHEYGLKALEDQRLKIAEINKLNDPFEFLGYNLNHDGWNKEVKRVKDALSKSTGILCFSKTYNNPVQWAHYAEQHKGLCLGFDIPDELLHKVKYIKRRPPFPNFRNLTEEVMKNSLLKKFKHWEYEQEWRMYIDLHENNIANSLYFESYSDHLLLKEVIIGLESSITKNEIEKKLTGKLNDIRIYTTRLSKVDFKIVKKYYKMRNKNEK